MECRTVEIWRDGKFVSEEFDALKEGDVFYLVEDGKRLTKYPNGLFLAMTNSGPDGLGCTMVGIQLLTSKEAKKYVG